MVNIALVLVCLVIGMLLKRVKAFPDSAYMAFNQFVIYVSLPALALIYIPQISIDLDVLYPVMTSWIILILAMVLIPLLAKKMDWDRKTTGCLILTAGLGNTSFVGFPVIEALYGTEALKIALLVDQPGSFVAVSTLGIVVASIYSSARTRKRLIARRILLFPPFITFIFALILNLTGFQFEGIPLGVLEKLGATLTPLALISVGMQLSFNMEGMSAKPVVYGLGYKLLLAPAFLFLLYVVILRGSGDVVEISIMEAAMAPMITGSIVAMTYGLNPRLASLMVGIGVPVSFLTLAFWHLFLSGVM